MKKYFLHISLIFLSLAIIGCFGQVTEDSAADAEEATSSDDTTAAETSSDSSAAASEEISESSSDTEESISFTSINDLPPITAPVVTRSDIISRSDKIYFPFARNLTNVFKTKNKYITSNGINLSDNVVTANETPNNFDHRGYCEHRALAGNEITEQEEGDLAKCSIGMVEAVLGDLCDGEDKYISIGDSKFKLTCIKTNESITNFTLLKCASSSQIEFLSYEISGLSISIISKTVEYEDEDLLKDEIILTGTLLAGTTGEDARYTYKKIESNHYGDSGYLTSSTLEQEADSFTFYGFHKGGFVASGDTIEDDSESTLRIFHIVNELFYPSDLDNFTIGNLVLGAGSGLFNISSAGWEYDYTTHWHWTGNIMTNTNTAYSELPDDLSHIDSSSTKQASVLNIDFSASQAWDADNYCEAPEGFIAADITEAAIQEECDHEIPELSLSVCDTLSIPGQNNNN